MNDLQTLMNAYSELRSEKYKNAILAMISEESLALITVSKVKTLTSTIERNVVGDYQIHPIINLGEILDVFNKDNPGIDATLDGPAAITELGLFSYTIKGDGFVGDWKLWVVPTP